MSTLASTTCAICSASEITKNHSEMLHRLADLDTRLTRVEQPIERVL
jgi:hypothetical protein